MLKKNIAMLFVYEETIYRIFENTTNSLID